jgi:hypothetical protein
MNVFIIALSMLHSVVTEESTVSFARQEVRVEAPPVVVERTLDAEALARAVLIHDRGIRSIDYRFRMTNPEVAVEKGVNEIWHVREDDRGRHWIRYDLREQWTGGIDPKSRKPWGMDLTQIHNHGEWVACITEINKSGGIRPPNDELSVSGTMKTVLGRGIEHNKVSRRLGEVLVGSSGLIIARVPDEMGVATLRASAVLDGHHTTLEVDVATQHEFVCVGIRRYDAYFNALKWSVQVSKIVRVDGAWLPLIADESTFYAVSLPEKEAPRYVETLTRAGVKKGMNYLTPEAQASLRKGFMEMFGAPHYPIAPLVEAGPARMELLEIPRVNISFSRADLSISVPGEVLWINDLTGEVSRIDMTTYPEDQP